ncbi:MAG: cryptochrome/photolyase family protein [Chitinophagaceae bacterium]|nr:cryptochrome/photolyase family protein [Chitinophagaceae bacterium]
MNAATIIFPHQLYKEHPSVIPGQAVYLVEEDLFFNQYLFHKQKIILHRAAMKYYQQMLEKKNKVEYIEAISPLSDVRKLTGHLSQLNISAIHYTDTVDNWLEKRIQESCKEYGIELIRHPSPNFLNRMEDVEEFFAKKKTYFQTDFYIWQRKQRNLLLEKNGQPIGGKWTFDTDNREKYPKGKKPPVVHFPKENAFVKEAREYGQKHFSSHYGESSPFNYPVTHKEAETWLDDFLQTRFHAFGLYEDAMVQSENILHHAVLTPMLNTGLLHPQDIIDKAIDAATQFDVPLNSLEGFIRQVTGWREFIRVVYEKEGCSQRTTNYWGFTRKIPVSFWNGTTGIHPVDTVIRKVLQTGYCHHIERLMVLGNFMLLCEFDPDDVYKWFMEMFVDAYDWVMVPNVYGMTQFADGGLMTTKPYISGSNYLLKMGDWNKGAWQAIWDGLFWRFMHVHRDIFLKNPRLGMLVRTYDKMSKEKQQQHLQNAEQFLVSL